MKLLSFKNEIKTEKSFPGLIRCDFTHEIKQAKATCEWLGPAIPKPVWDQVLAYFQWTYDTTKSESQVRLFVNLKHKTWAAWAFPQEARTGMSARELDTPEKAKQRAQFADSDGWIYFGTVHHHCSAGAFQSGTDKSNEESQDGLHITIGNMDKARYDMHARFYIGGFGFEPDMAKFWDIGEDLQIMLPMSLWDNVARFQMCAKAPANTEYPVQWKENLIEVKTTFPIQTSTSQGTPSGYGYYRSDSYHRHWENNLALWLRAELAVGELADYIQTDNPKCSDLEIAELIKRLADGAGEWDYLAKICEICGKYGTDPMQMWKEIPFDNSLSKALNTFRIRQRNSNGSSVSGGIVVAGTKKVEVNVTDEPNMYGQMMD